MRRLPMLAVSFALALPAVWALAQAASAQAPSAPASAAVPVPVLPATDAAYATVAAPVRNPRWATPLVEPGLRNFFKVSPTLYRGAQPTAEGMRSLRQLGVRTVVSLRAFHGEHRKVEEAGLLYRRIPFAIWHPEKTDMTEFLEIVRDPARQPVFVHCMRGADRTGLAVAVYRVCVEGWTAADARDEMVNGGYSYETRFHHIERHLLAVDAETCARRTAAALVGGPAIAPDAMPALD